MLGINVMSRKAGVKMSEEAKKLNLKILFVPDGFSGLTEPYDVGFFLVFDPGRKVRVVIKAL